MKSISIILTPRANGRICGGFERSFFFQSTPPRSLVFFIKYYLGFYRGLVLSLCVGYLVLKEREGVSIFHPNDPIIHPALSIRIRTPPPFDLLGMPKQMAELGTEPVAYVRDSSMQCVAFTPAASVALCWKCGGREYVRRQWTSRSYFASSRQTAICPRRRCQFLSKWHRPLPLYARGELGAEPLSFLCSIATGFVGFVCLCYFWPIRYLEE